MSATRSGSRNCWGHGLLRPSFVPPPEIRRLRMLTRYRVQLMGDRLRATVRLELMLEDASIKLYSVASSLTTVSARAMLTAMIEGETDPLRLADMAKGKMRRNIPGPGAGLTGNFDANHARLARSMLRRLDLVEQAMAELDQVIVDACRPWQHQISCCKPFPEFEPVDREVGDRGGARCVRSAAAWSCQRRQACRQGQLAFGGLQMAGDVGWDSPMAAR
jgi:hypothetical protein